MKTRILFIGFALAVASGCHREPPATHAGGKSVDHWIGELKSPDAKARKHAVTKLGTVGPSDPLIVPALTGALKDADPAVRCEAVVALARCGPDAAEAVPALTEATRDKDPKVREYAEKALDRIRAPR
jgi:HEAT repeat protein